MCVCARARCVCVCVVCVCARAVCLCLVCVLARAGEQAGGVCVCGVFGRAFGRVLRACGWVARVP